MAFTANTFVPAGEMGNSNVARTFNYRTGDNTAAVVGANYFDAAAATSGGLGLKNADLIFCQQLDGSDYYEVTVVAGVVAIVKTLAFA